MFLLLALSALAAGPAVAGARLALPVNHAARLQISGQAGSVVVGDPAVADALVIDPHTIYVQGKAYGQTEVIVLDRNGKAVWQGDVAVVTPNEGRITVVRGTMGSSGGGFFGSLVSMAGPQVSELTCADVCSPVVKAPKDH
jgi:Flp pilus assembly secretin CpaC